MSNSAVGLDILPTAAAHYPVGFSLDIGSSLTKLVYRGKANPGNLQTSFFDRHDTQHLVEYIKEHVDMKNSDDTTCFCTGVGIKSFGQTVSEELGVNIKTEQEFVCCMKAFQYLSKLLPQDALFSPISRSAFEHAYTMSMEWTKTYEDSLGDVGTPLAFGSANDTCDTMYERYNQSIDNLYPCIAVTIGSGISILSLSQDGKTELIDCSNRGGRTFLGLGAIITGAKTFDELIDLASNGNGKNCNTVIGDLHNSSGVQDSYDQIPAGFNLFFFGRAMGKTRDDFKKEDLANALVEYICQDICQLINYIAKAKNILNVFFLGSFLNRDVTKEILTRCFVEISVKQNATKLMMRMIALGPHLPAIGAWLMGCEKTIDNTGDHQVGDRKQ